MKEARHQRLHIILRQEIGGPPRRVSNWSFCPQGTNSSCLPWAGWVANYVLPQSWLIESCPRGSLQSFMWGISYGFSLANHFELPGSESVFGVSQDPPMCVRASLSQDGFQRKGLWVDLTSFLFWPPRSFLVGKVSLTSRMRNMWSLIFYLGRAQPPLSIVLLLIFWSFCSQGMNSNC